MKVRQNDPGRDKGAKISISDRQHKDRAGVYEVSS